MVLEKNFCLQLTEIEKKGPFIYFELTGHCLYQCMSNVPLAYVLRIQRMPSVSSVCLAYDERMSNVLFIRSHTLKMFEHVQKIILASAYYNVHRGMPACEERTRRMPSIPLTYICVYLRIRAYNHTLAYTDVIRCSVTAL